MSDEQISPLKTTEIIYLGSFYMCANKGVVLKVTYGQRVQNQRPLSTERSMMEKSFYWLKDASGLILGVHKVGLLNAASLWTLRWRHVEIFRYIM